MSYNRDLQEDKERLFDSADTVRATVRLCAAMLNSSKANRKACLSAAQDPVLLATDLADYLVLKGMPFRQAHHAVGALVALAEQLGKRLTELTIQELQSVDTAFSPDALKSLNLKRALTQRKAVGAPGTAQVQAQLTRWRRYLSQTSSKASGSGKSSRQKSMP
jgi:argininosuccinate lyase